MKKILIFILFFFIITAIFFPGYFSRFRFFLGKLLIRNNDYYVNENDYRQNDYYSRRNNRNDNDRRRNHSENDSYDDDYNVKENKKPNSNGENYLKKHDDDRSSKEKESFSFLDIIKHILGIFIFGIVSAIETVLIFFSPILIVFIIVFISEKYCSFSFDCCKCLNDLISCCQSPESQNQKTEQKNKITKNNSKSLEKAKKKYLEDDRRYGFALPPLIGVDTNNRNFLDSNIITSPKNLLGN